MEEGKEPTTHKTSSTHFTLTNLDDGKDYRIKIKDTNKDGEGS
jgi:hypothetical protein